VISEPCRTLIQDFRKYSAEYGEGLSSHFPMALLALERLGGDEARLRAFASYYEGRLRLKEPAEIASVARYEEEIRERGADAVLRAHVPRFVPGIGSEAFHGVIRTAYAVDMGDDVDLADALWSWEMDYAELGATGAPKFASAEEAFLALHRDERFPAGTVSGRTIVERIGRVVAMPAFDDYRGIASVTLPDLARMSTRVYVATGNFTALHMVTACHATRTLAAFIDDLQPLAIALLAAYVTIGRPAPEAAHHDAPPWEAIAARALESNDDHDLKLVYSALCEEEAYGWGLHRQAAAVRMKMLA
jgi:hypothetical protein